MRVVIAEDLALLRDGLTRLLTESGFEVVAAVEDGTPREREVLGLMAEGRTNHAIAERLVVTEGAVEKHVSNIFGKLGLPPSDLDHRRVLAVMDFRTGAGAHFQSFPTAPPTDRREASPLFTEGSPPCHGFDCSPCSPLV